MKRPRSISHVKLRRALETMAEADEWRAVHGRDDDGPPDYASGLLSAAYDIAGAAGISRLGVKRAAREKATASPRR